MTDARRLYLVCPACERAEPADEPAPCPECGSERTYLHHAPAWPDPTDEAYVKLDAEAADPDSDSTE